MDGVTVAIVSVGGGPPRSARRARRRRRAATPADVGPPTGMLLPRRASGSDRVPRVPAARRSRRVARRRGLDVRRAVRQPTSRRARTAPDGVARRPPMSARARPVGGSNTRPATARRGAVRGRRRGPRRGAGRRRGTSRPAPSAPDVSARPTRRQRRAVAVATTGPADVSPATGHHRRRSRRRRDADGPEPVGRDGRGGRDRGPHRAPATLPATTAARGSNTPGDRREGSITRPGTVPGCRPGVPEKKSSGAGRVAQPTPRPPQPRPPGWGAVQQGD